MEAILHVSHSKLLPPSQSYVNSRLLDGIANIYQWEVKLFHFHTVHIMQSIMSIPTSVSNHQEASGLDARKMA